MNLGRADLAKFRHVGKKVKIFCKHLRVYFVIDKFSTDFGKMCMFLVPVLIVVNGQILKII